MQKDARETFGSTWGTIFVTAGAAIGLGNIWRFPYMMGIFGGAGFLLVYLAVVVFFGIPGLMVEWTLGRHTRRGPVGAFERVGMPGGRWWGRLLLLTVTMAASYYAVVIGWVLYYGVQFAVTTPEAPPVETFAALTVGVAKQAPYLAATVAAGCLALYSGVKDGIERISKIVLPLFFGLFALLMVRSLTLDGAWEGVRYYLLPRLDQITPGTLLAATGQAYFSLALGGTFMLIYGSYMRPEERLGRNAVLTALADSSAAFMAGLVVVPAVFAFHIDMQSGPPLLFVVMPEVFERLPWGGFFGSLFFASVFLIALLSLIAAYEVMVAALQDELGWSRGRSLWLIFGLELVLAVPSMLSLNYLYYSDLIWGSTMQPVGAVLSVVALAWCLSRARALEELRMGGEAVPDWLFLWIKYVIPPAIVGALVYGWVG